MLERLPENVRVGLCLALKPIVFPVHDFVERWYYTEYRVRLARVAGTALWWKLIGNKKPRPDEPQTADEVIDELYDFASLHKPLPEWEGRKK